MVHCLVNSSEAMRGFLFSLHLFSRWLLFFVKLFVLGLDANANNFLKCHHSCDTLSAAKALTS